jgi:hypothetical protein
MAEVDPQKAKQDAEIAQLKAQIAQLQAGMSGQNLLQFGNIAGPVMGAGGQAPAPRDPTFATAPQGYAGLPGAAGFAPSGVMFAGGSPWPVSPHPANVQNGMVAATLALNTLNKLGLLDKLFGRGGGQQSQGQSPVNSPDVTNLALDQLWK